MDLTRNLIQRINVGDSLTRSAAARPGHLAMVDGGRQWTYQEFNSWVNQLAHGLAARGYTRGDALGMASGNSAEFLAVYFACAKLGLVCVPVNLGWRSEEVAYVLDHSGENVASIEVEKAVYAADPRVAEAVVVGLPHDRWDEAITAVVVPKAGETIDPAQLLDALRGLLDGYKVPKAVIVADELPKTLTGKIQKNVVRDTHAGHYQS